MLLPLLMNLGMFGGPADVPDPEIASIDFTADRDHLHFTAPTDRLHYTADRDRLHYTAPKEP